MAIIFYSVAGEGMGHATRSEVVIKHLLKKGHTLVIFSYQRAFEYLKDVFKNKKNVLEIVEITGINFIYEQNEFNIKKTLLEESKKLNSFLIANFKIYIDKVMKYSPSIVITDFEPVAGVISKLMKIPLICIDNQGLFTKCKINEKFLHELHIRVANVITNLPGDYNFIVTVFDLPIIDKYRKNTYMIGPVIRKPLANAKLSLKDHFLVYQTSTSNDKLIAILKASGKKFIIYGFNKDIKDDNIIFKKHSSEGFADDFASCKGVITNGGFTLISEAVYFRKPIYSIPVKRQIEQEINGHYIQESGYGHCSKEITQDDLRSFIENLEDYRKNLSKIDLMTNDFSIIDEKLESAIKAYKKSGRKATIAKIKKNYFSFEKKFGVKKINNELKKFERSTMKKFNEIKKKIRSI